MNGYAGIHLPVGIVFDFYRRGVGWMQYLHGRHPGAIDEPSQNAEVAEIYGKYLRKFIYRVWAHF
jgi:hypothetical protein